MDNNDLLFAIGQIDDELIEASEQKPTRNFKVRASLLAAAILIIAFSVTAVGKVLAHANAKRCEEKIPDLD